MNKQALQKAIADCRVLIQRGLGPNGQYMNRHQIERGVTGLRTIETLLSEPPGLPNEVHVIEVNLNEMEQEESKGKAPICPRCQNEEFSPGAKFCKICGFPMFATQKD